MDYIYLAIAWITIIIYAFIGAIDEEISYIREKYRFIFIIISSLCTLKLALSVWGSTNSNVSVIFTAPYLLLLVAYIIVGIVLIANCLKILFNTFFHWIVLIVLYVGVLILVTSVTNASNYAIFPETVLSILVLKLLLVFTRLRSSYSKEKKLEIFNNKMLAKQEEKKEKLREYISKLKEEYADRIDINFLNMDYRDLWLNNNQAMEYLKKSYGKLVELTTIADYFNNKDGNLPKDIRYINKDVEDIYLYMWRDLKASMNSLNTLKLGMEGEAIVDDTINIHKYITNISGLTISDDNSQRVECDNILITDKGIFILEVKNYGTEGRFTLNIDVTGRWERVYNNKSYVMDSPFAQNSRHIGIIKNILFERNIDVPVYGIVVIANDTVDIVNNSEHKVIRVGSLMDTITNFYTGYHLDLDVRNKIESILNSLRENQVKHTFSNYTMYTNHFEEMKKIIGLNNAYMKEVIEQENMVYDSEK